MKIKNYDYIVVGGGSAGCALANRLSEDSDCAVLLLEGGCSDIHPFSLVPAASALAIASPKFNWMYELEPDPSRSNRVDVWPAGRCLGGGSSINGMMFIRGHRYDYESWEQAGNPGWGYGGVLPYFKRMETNERGGDKWRGDAGPLSVSDSRISSELPGIWLQAAVQSGVVRNPDLNGEVPDGVDFVQASQRRGWRHSTARAYIGPIKNRQNFKLILNAPVTRVLIEDKKAVGVEYSHKGKTNMAKARRGVVLSAGSIISPKLLMLSGIGPRSELENVGISVELDAPGVGKNLQEHPGLVMQFRVKAPTLGSDTGFFRNLWHGINYMLRGRGPLSTSIGHAQAFVKTDSSYSVPNVQMIMGAFAYDFDEVGAQLCSEQVIGCAIGVMRPASRGEILLKSSDPLDKPIIRHQLLGAEEDVVQLREGGRIMRNIMRQAAFKDLYDGERVPGEKVRTDDEWEKAIRDAAFPMYHPVGTCKMGNDPLAVVDEKLRVRGIESLWVADASIMPTLPAANTNATAIMIGEKAADLIKEACL